MGQKAGISNSNRGGFLPLGEGQPGMLGDPLRGFRFENDDGAGGGGSPPPPDPEKEKLQALQSWLSEQTAGLKGNRDQILTEKKEVEQKLKDLQGQIEGLGDIDRVKELLQRFENDEELKLIEDGKIDEVISRRTENLRKSLEAERDGARSALDEANSKLDAKTETISRLTIDAKIREIGLSMDPPMNPLGLADAIRAARDTFVLNDDDQPVAQQDGAPVIGKDGKTPLGIEEWLQTMFDSGKTLWWGVSSGGGANGGGDGGADTGSDGVDIEKLSPRDKLKAGLKRAS